MKPLYFIILYFFLPFTVFAVNEKQYDIIVDRNGEGNFATLQEAISSLSGYNLEKAVSIFIRNGFYKEKLVLPAEIHNIKFTGESCEKTIISYDDYASKNNVGTFGSYTFYVGGNDITFENLTIENSSGELGQAVALHTDGDRLVFRNCRILGNQDTIFTGGVNHRLYFQDCYIDGTTDFIFGPSTAWFENCLLHCKRKSYITAASTPEEIQFGYIFNKCTITVKEGISRVYLGRPWRAYAMVLFMNSQMPEGINPKGWHNWRNPANEKTARYMEYNNSGIGADVSKRAPWVKILTKKEAKIYTVKNVLKGKDGWNPLKQHRRL